MKIQKLAVAAALVASFVNASAGTAHAGGRAVVRADDTLACDQFTALLDPHDRYVQTTRIDVKGNADELMRAFQEPGEEALSVSESSLHIELDPRACTLDKASRAHFLDCTNANDQHIDGRFHFSRVQFTYTGKSRLGAAQSVVVDRELQIVSVTIHASVQTKPVNGRAQERVVADITVDAAVGAAVRTLHVTKDLGEWTASTNRSNWDRCLVNPPA